VVLECAHYGEGLSDKKIRNTCINPGGKNSKGKQVLPMVLRPSSIPPRSAAYLKPCLPIKITPRSFASGQQSTRASISALLQPVS
jgi:hypothetical protein